MKKLQYKGSKTVYSLWLVVAFFFFSYTSLSQVGINTTNPRGTLDVTSVDNTGLVLPRVSSIEAVTDGNGNPPVMVPWCMILVETRRAFIKIIAGFV